MLQSGQLRPVFPASTAAVLVNTNSLPLTLHSLGQCKPGIHLISPGIQAPNHNVGRKSRVVGRAGVRSCGANSTIVGAARTSSRNSARPTFYAQAFEWNDERAHSPAPGNTMPEVATLPRFERVYCPRRACWLLLDRERDTFTPCVDQGAAAERAALLEAVRRLLRDVGAK